MDSIKSAAGLRKQGKFRLDPYVLRLAALGLWLGLAAAVQAEPLPISNQHPLAQIHLAPGLAEAVPQGEGSLRMSLAAAWSNTINRERGDFLIDAESREGALALDYGLSDDISFGLRQALIYRGAGITDSWIDDWHQFFGLPRGPRAKVPEDEYVIQTSTRDGETFRLNERGTHFSDLDLRLKYTFYTADDKTFFAALMPALRLPTGAQGYGQSSLDYGLSLLTSKLLPQWQFDTGVSFFYFADNSLDELEYVSEHWNGFVNIEYKLVSGMSILADALVESALLKNVPQYPDYQVYVDLGLRFPLTENIKLDLSFRENPFQEDSTTDFTLFAALHWQAAPSEAKNR